MPRRISAATLNQLRAFEAAARHESMKDGAKELCVTPAAVGHQIKALEQALGIPLFYRQTRKITLTEEGRKLADSLSSAFDLIAQSLANTGSTRLSGRLKITIAPFFGNRWLLPRLDRFHAQFPNIEIEPMLSFEYVDLEQSECDAALRYGDGQWEGLSATLIFRDHVRPVCAPQLLEGLPQPITAKDILTLPIAHASSWREDWHVWAKSHGLTLEKAASILEFDSRAYVFDAALSGQAVILADPRMTGADEEARRLVAAHLATIERPQGIYLVSRNERASDPRLALFADWLITESQGKQNAS